MCFCADLKHTFSYTFRPSVVVLSVAMLLTSCGGGGGSTSTSSSSGSGGTPPALTINGNWALVAQSVVFTGGTVQIGGALSTANGQITGVVHVLNSSCFDINADVTVSGSLNSSTHVATITTASVAGQVVTATATLSSDSKTLSAGTYQITGGCGSGDHGSLTGFAVPPFTNTYAGTFTSVGGQTVNVSVSVTQSASADSHGIYSLSGTVTSSNSPCFSSGTISSSAVAGAFFQVDIATTPSTGDIQFIGFVDQTGKTITGNYNVLSGPCTGDSGSGTISHS